ncbi:MAG: YheT family hydrolase, partial [Pseudobdellovibrionaceae bacterium]
VVLLLNKKIHLQPCQPPVWARNGHQQTLVAHFLPSPPLPNDSQLVQMTLPDGDRLVARLFAKSSDKVISLFHGLGGSIQSDYIRRSVQIFSAQGYTVFAVNHRGQGEGLGLAKKPYHSGCSEDLSAALKYIRNIYPQAKHLAFGFSLGANALLHLLSRVQDSTLVQPDFAVAVNPPVDLQQAALLLKKGLNRIYDWRFVQDCRQAIKYKIQSGLLHENILLPIGTTLYDVDRIYTAPAIGLRSREEYYSTCSTHKFLENIKTPTVILMSEDDPFIDFKAHVSAVKSDQVYLHLEKYGGHLGYLSKYKTPLGTYRWLDYACSTFAEKLLGY